MMIEERKIRDYEDEMSRREAADVRLQQWNDAIYGDFIEELCPVCCEPLWLEMGYWSLYEMLLWEGFYYPNMYGWDMGLSHYRRP